MTPWGDISRRGRPFSKDPFVVRYRGRYLLYFSVPPYGDGRKNDGWAIGIAESTDLVNWEKIGEILPRHDYEHKGLCAPGGIILDGKIHLFYQTYGSGRRDAICHAVSKDGISFVRNLSNPVFRPTGTWNAGRAIDAEVIEHNEKLFLYFATRDPAMKIQMLGVAGAAIESGFGRGAWTQLCDGPILKPELPWEGKCIEAASVCKRGGKFYMFYAGSYNNRPQQVGCAVSEDGISWKRIWDKPFLRNGLPGQWNSSESGHPNLFLDNDGQNYLFFQGNNDRGKTWYLSWVKIDWKDGKPYIAGE